MLNQVALMGRLTRDPELKYTSTNKPVTSFKLASTEITRATTRWTSSHALHGTGPPRW